MEDEQFSNDDGEVSIIGASSGQRSGRHSRTENERKLLIDYDAVLVSIGGWGRFQQVLYHGVCLPVVFATVLMFTVTVFSAAVPKFRCRIPGCDVANGTYQDAFEKHFNTFTIPVTEAETAQCRQFKHNKTTINDDQCLATKFDVHEITSCNDWIYDKSIYETTFMSEANIVCGEGWKGPLSQSIFFFGVLIAALSSGLLADKFGRRHVTMGCILLLAGSSLGMIFVNTYELYIVMSFLMAIGQAGVFLVSFILAMEMVGPEKRVYCGIAIEIYFVLGEVLASGMAYWQRDWRIVIIISTVPVFMFLLYWPVLPESIRWLLAKKRYEEAQKATNRICYWNRTPLVNIYEFSDYDDESSPGAPSAEKETMLDLLKDSVLAWRLLNLCSTWLIIILGYYGLSLSSVSLSGDPYLNFFLVSLVEIPGYIFAWIGMEKFGRRPTMVVSLITAGIALLANAAVELSGKSHETFFFWFNLIAFLVGKCGLTSAFGAVYVYSSELFPTSIRTAGVGTCSTCGRLGAIVTPWISAQARRTPWIVMVIFGGSAVVSGLLNLFLPETLGRHLPETLAQAKHLGLEEALLRVPPINDDEEEPLLRS